MNDPYPICGVPGCEKPAPVRYTDLPDARCWDCLDADRDLGEAPLTEGV